MSILRFDNVSYQYPGEDFDIIDGLSFSVEPGSGHCLEYGNIVFLPLPGPSENREGEDNGQPRAPVRNTRMKE